MARKSEPYESPRGRHRHQCPHCDCVWEHANSCIDLPDRAHQRAHTCPKCGREDYGQYHGDEPPVSKDHHEG